MTKPFTLSPQGTIGSYTIEGTSVSIKGRVVIQPALEAKLALVDVIARQSFDPQDHIIMDGLIGQLTQAGYKIRYDSDVRSFFNAEKRWDEFLKSGDVQGVVLTEEEKKVAANVAALRAKFEKAFTLPTPPYPWAPVPEGTDPLKGITIGTRVIKRGGHTIGLKTFEKVWKMISKAVRKGETGYLGQANVSGYFGRAIRLSSQLSTVDIGCQTISRYQIEAVAKKLGLPA